MSDLYDLSAEALIVTLLRDRFAARGLNDVAVSTSRDLDRGKLLRVQRAGGAVFAEADYFEDRPILILEAWASTDEEAEQIASAGRREIQSLVDEPWGGAHLTWLSEVGGLTYFPHPDTQMPRYQTTQQIQMVE